MRLKTAQEADPRLKLKKIKVGVFPRDSKTVPRFTAYTYWYNPQWDGCCEHTVEATNGTEAKKLAIQEHKENCVSDERPSTR